jgi:type IV pilus assembly protein PilA
MANQRGFTLVEILIGVAIVGILAALAMPAYNGYIAKVQVAETLEMSYAVKEKAARYAIDHNGTVALLTTTAPWR